MRCLKKKKKTLPKAIETVSQIDKWYENAHTLVYEPFNKMIPSSVKMDAIKCIVHKIYILHILS